MDFWSCYNSDVISQFLDAEAAASSKIKIWQQVEDVRRQYIGYMNSFGQLEVRITIESSESGTMVPILTDLPVFVFIEGSHILFKRDHYHVEEMDLVFHMPFELRLKENRSLERFDYQYQDFKEIDIHSLYWDPIQKDGEKKKPLWSLTCTLVDISISGAGIVVQTHELEKLNIDEQIFITKLSDQELPERMKASIVYIEDYRIKDVDEGSLSKVGLKFNESLESVNYQSIRAVVDRKQKKVRGLDVDTFHGLDPADQERLLSEVALKNKVMAREISENIQYLDRLRYLTTQMKKEFLLQMNKDVLATALRMSSKELIYELLIEVTDTIRDEMLEKLDVAKPASSVAKSQEQICQIMREKEASGDLVLDATAYVTYV